METKKKTDISITLRDGNIISIPLVSLTSILIFLIFYLMHGTGNILEFTQSDNFWIIAIPAVLIGISFHELIHGFCFVIFGRHSINDLKFGINFKALTFYAHCIKPVNVNAYRISTAMPGILLGILPIVISFFSGSGTLLFWGLVFTITAAGDGLILITLIGIPSNIIVEDHPKNIGCILISEVEYNENKLIKYLRNPVIIILSLAALLLFFGFYQIKELFNF